MLILAILAIQQIITVQQSCKGITITMSEVTVENYQVHARETIKNEYGEQLVRAARVFDSIRRFPVAQSELEESALVRNIDEPSGRAFRTPYVVLPAREVRRPRNTMTRRVGAIMQVSYVSKASLEAVGVAGSGLPYPTPTPEEVSFDCRAIALSTETHRPATEKFKYYSQSIGGAMLDLYSGALVGLNGSYPTTYHRSLLDADGSRETRDFATYSVYPPEVLEDHMHEFHASRLDAFEAMLGEVATALENRELNPL